jgi:predicted phage-related endonuclease
MQRTTIPKPEHGSIEWLRLRQRDETGYPVVSASEAAAVHSEHRYKTKYALAADKLAAEPEITETNRAMERGTRLEPVILQWVSDEIGEEVYAPEVMYSVTSGGASLIATLDGIVGEQDNPKRVVEIKTYNREWDETADIDGHGPLPAYWFWQGVHQAACAGVDEVLWGIFDSTLDLHLYIQKMDESIIGKHVGRVSDFCRHIASGNIPSEWEHTYEDLAKTLPVDKNSREIDSQFNLLSQLRQVQGQKKQLSDLEDELKAEIALALGGATTGTIDGNVAVTWKQQSRSGFDSKRFASEHPELYSQYQSTNTFRVLRLKGTK